MNATPKFFRHLVLGALFIWAVSGVLIQQMFYEQSERGLFGDMFGAANSLFSALTLAGLIYTIFVQQKQIADAERERHEDRAAQTEQTRLAGEQAESLFIASQLNSINSRIDGYNRQVDELVLQRKEYGITDAEKIILQRLKDERRNLYLCLDDILEKLRPGARGPLHSEQPRQ